jgi:prophage regulatory protein
LEIFILSITQVISYWFLLRLQDVLQANGQGRSTFYNQLAKGLWTRPVPIGMRAVAWPAGEIGAVIAARIAGQTNDQIRALVKELEAARKTAPHLIANLCNVAAEPEMHLSPGSGADPGIPALKAKSNTAHKAKA